MNEYLKNIDAEALIYEVSMRSELWNTNTSDYRNLKKRQAAWDEICRVIYDDYDLKNQDTQDYISRTIQRKWKCIRDTYMRERRGTKKTKKYRHSTALSFLNINTKRPRPKSMTDDSEEEENSNGFEDSEEEDDEDWEEYEQDEAYQVYANKEEEVKKYEEIEEEMEEKPFLQPIARKLDSSNQIDSNEYVLSDQQMPSSSSNSRPKNTSPSIPALKEDDEDRLFLLSLVNDLKRVPQYNKLRLKSEILLVISKWQVGNVKNYIEEWSEEKM